MSAGSEPARSPDPAEVVYSFSPLATFTRTLGWPFVAIPLLGVVGGIIDLIRGGAPGVAALTISISLGVCGLLYLGSRAVDRAQERIRVEVLTTGVLRHRNILGRTREIPLRSARSVDVKELRGKPRVRKAEEGASAGRLRDTELQGEIRGSPHVTQIRVRDERGRRHVVTLSGPLPRNEIRGVTRAIEAVRDRSS